MFCHSVNSPLIYVSDNQCIKINALEKISGIVNLLLDSGSTVLLWTSVSEALFSDFPNVIKAQLSSKVSMMLQFLCTITHYWERAQNVPVGL